AWLKNSRKFPETSHRVRHIFQHAGTHDTIQRTRVERQARNGGDSDKSQTIGIVFASRRLNSGCDHFGSRIHSKNTASAVRQPACECARTTARVQPQCACQFASLQRPKQHRSAHLKLLLAVSAFPSFREGGVIIDCAEFGSNCAHLAVDIRNSKILALMWKNWMP